MKIVYPISQADRHLAPILGNLIARHRHLEHEAIIMPTPSCFETAVEFKQLIEDSFNEVEIATLSLEPRGGWPSAPNTHFQKAAQHMLAYGSNPGNAGRFFWHEMDCTPLHGDWLNALINEAARKQAIYHGPYGTLPDGQFMLGTAIWPCDLWVRSKLLKFVAGQPFDIYMRHEVFRQSSESTILQHRWRTEKYVRRGANSKENPGQIIMSRCPEDRVHAPNEPLPIPEGTAMVHGCRDGSLAKLILKDTPAMPEEVTQGEPEPEFAATAR